jgi:multisubunit Na+/H+ antiporter MnhG subunit
MKQDPTKKSTFGAAVMIAALGVVVFVVDLFRRTVSIWEVAAFLLVIVAFVLLYFGRKNKGL